MASQGSVSTLDLAAIPTSKPGPSSTMAGASTSTVGLSTERIDELLEELEDGAEPIYLRDSTTYRFYLRLMKEKELSAMIHKGAATGETRPKWKVQDVDLNAWRHNKIDHRTIYGLGELLGHSRKKKTQKRTPQSSPSVDLDSGLEREKTYIMSIRQVARSPDGALSRRFMAQTMNTFNRPKSPDSMIQYCSPRNKLEQQPGKQNKPKLEKVTRLPSSVHRFTRQICRGSGCPHDTALQQQFCDVLGPAVCRSCIESANKKIAQEVQKTSFPTMDFSVTTIVAPKLAALMVNPGNKKSDRNRNRKRGSNASTSSSGAASVKLPSLPNPPKSSEFCRPTLERHWMQRSKTMTSVKSPTTFSVRDSVDSETLALQFSRANTKCSITLKGGSSR